jgi:hypothetical protein
MNTRINQALKKASTGVLNESLKLNGDTLYYGHSSVSIQGNFFIVHASFINLEEDAESLSRFSKVKSHSFQTTNSKFASQMLYLARTVNKLDEEFLNSLKFVTKEQVCEMPFVISDEALIILLKTFDLLLDKSFKVKKEPSKCLCHRPHKPQVVLEKTDEDIEAADDFFSKVRNTIRETQRQQQGA